MKPTRTVAAGSGFACLVAAQVVLAAPPDAGSPRGRHDGGAHETSDQRAFRMHYIEDTMPREREITKHHVWTPEMSTASWKHWRRAYRALRIRDLAEDDHEDATVARVDAYLTKITDHFLKPLAELTAAAPEIPPPPTLLSPSNGARLAAGTAVSFKMAPYKDATHYYCWFWEPGGHHWSNLQANGEGYGTSPECDIPAGDPHWSAFRSGSAEFYGRAILSAKADAGKEYRVWSEPVKVDVVVAGGPSNNADGGSK